jgi:hypothetical protein
VRERQSERETEREIERGRERDEYFYIVLGSNIVSNTSISASYEHLTSLTL